MEKFTNETARNCSEKTEPPLRTFLSGVSGDSEKILLGPRKDVKFWGVWLPFFVTVIMILGSIIDRTFGLDCIRYLFTLIGQTLMSAIGPIAVIDTSAANGSFVR